MTANSMTPSRAGRAPKLRIILTNRIASGSEAAAMVMVATGN